MKNIHFKLDKLRRLFQRYWRLALFLALPLVAFVVAWALGWLIDSNQSFFASAEAAIVGKHFYALWATVCLIFLSAYTYLYIDFRHHRAALQPDISSARYTLPYHIKVVNIPLVRYRWRELSYWATTGVTACMALTFGLVVLVSHVSASPPVVATGSASGISVGGAAMQGSITENNGPPITRRGINYNRVGGESGTLAQEAPVNNSYLTWGRPGVEALTGAISVAYHDNAIYATESGRVAKYSTAGVYLSSITLTGQPDDEGLGFVGGVAFDSNNNMYTMAADGTGPDWRVITKFNSDGDVLARWGTKGGGANEFSTPTDIAVDSNDVIYVLDASKGKIFKFDAAGNTQGEILSPGSGPAQIQTAYGFTIYNDNIYIADSMNSRILIVDLAGNPVGAWGTNGSSLGQLNFPSDVAVTAGSIYVTEGMNSRVQIFNHSGVGQSFWGVAGSGEGQFTMPKSIALDASGQVYVVEMESARIQRFDGAGGNAYTFGLPSPSSLPSPGAVTIGRDGRVYVATGVQAGGNPVQVSSFDKNGQFIAKWGSVGTGSSQFSHIEDIASDDSGYIYTIDSDNDRVQRFDQDGNNPFVFGSSGSGAGQFDNPTSIAIGPDGNIWVADANRIQRFDPSGTPQSSFPVSGSDLHLTVDKTNVLYVSNTSTGNIHSYDVSGTQLAAWAYGSGSVYDITQDHNGAIYTTIGDGEVRAFSPGGDLLFTKGSSGSGDQQFDNPMSVAVAKDGRMFVSDRYNQRMHRFPVDMEDPFLMRSLNLECGSQYNFAAFATNDDGTSYGSNQTFTTSSCATATTPGAPTGLGVVEWGGVPYATYNKAVLDWDGPTNSGGRAVTGYAVEYKRPDQSTWDYVEYGPEVTGKTDDKIVAILANLQDQSVYDIRVAAITSQGTGPFATLQIQTPEGGATHTVSSCQDLRRIDLDLIGTYNLTADIDCSGYNDYSELQQSDGFYGFLPIGFWLGIGEDRGFRGVINGNGYTISGLTIDFPVSGGTTFEGVGFISFSLGGTVQNLAFENLQINTNYRGPVGGLVAHGLKTTLSNVSVNGTINVLVDGASLSMIGGLVGYLDLDSSLTKGYADVALVYTASGEGMQYSAIGGLIGGVGNVVGASDYTSSFPALAPLVTQYGSFDDIPGATIQNVYTTGTITLSGNNGLYVAGLVGAASQSTIRYGYAANSIDASQVTSLMGVVGGIVSQIFPSTSLDRASSVRDTFSAVSTLRSGAHPPPLPDTPDASYPLGMIFNAGGSYPDSVAANNFFDRQLTNQDTCFYTAVLNVSYGPNTDTAACQAVNVGGTQPNHFRNNTTNPPLNTWDFATPVWYKHLATYPTFQPGETVPGPPRDLGGTPTTSSMVLTWNPPSTDGGSPITDYRIQYRLNGTNDWIEYSHPPSSTITSYTIPGLISGQRYDFQVSALNAVGQSAWVLGIYDVLIPGGSPANPTTPATSTNPGNPATNPTTPRRPTRPTGSTPVTATPATPTNPNSPEASANTPGHLDVNRLPENLPGLASFARKPSKVNLLPYFFLSWLLLLALYFAYRAWREYRYQQAMVALIANTKATSQAVSNFLAITTHYVNTPLSILKGAIELIASKHSLQPDFVKQFQAKLLGLQTTTTNLVAQAEQGLTLGATATSATPAVTTTTVATADQQTTKQLWLPLLGIASAIAITDIVLLLTKSYGHSWARMLNHLIWAVAGTAIVMVTYWFWKKQKQLQASTRQQLHTERTLLENKNQFLGAAATSLTTHAAQLRVGTAGLEQFPDTKLLTNGLGMLDRLAASLTKAQRFATLSPALPRLNVRQVYQQDIAPALSQQATEAGASLQDNLPADLMLQMQPDELTHILGTTIDNAIQYGGTSTNVSTDTTTNTTPANNTAATNVVQVSGRPGHSKATLTVKDNGPGISPDIQAHLFEPLTRGTDTSTFDHQGLGLNLYLTRLILQKYGGNIHLTSQPQQGTTVTMTMPNSHTDPTGLAPQVVVPKG